MGAMDALHTAGHAQKYLISMEMVATTKWSGTETVETVFDSGGSETAAYQLQFASGDAFADVETTLSSGGCSTTSRTQRALTDSARSTSSRKRPQRRRQVRLMTWRTCTWATGRPVSSRSARASRPFPR